MELTYNQIERLAYRFPQLELSYETFAHKKVSSNYDICLSIPNGKKQMIWFSYYEDQDVCFLIDINKEQKITKIVKYDAQYELKLAFGTVFYGTICTEKQIFVIEDVYYFCGLPTKHFTFGEKLNYLNKFMSWNIECPINFALPYMTMVEGNNMLLESLSFYESMINKCAYPIHHIQFRSSEKICPYLNHTYKKKQEQAIVYEPEVILFPRTDLNFTAQSTLQSAVFRVMADIQNDIYHLFAYDGKIKGYTYVNIAYIGTRKLSVFMNKLFRNIRENENVDYGEESEDEDTFQNVNPDKYVDLKKEYKMLCTFNTKFKKWVPVNVVEQKCVNINELIYNVNTKDLPYKTKDLPYKTKDLPYKTKDSPYKTKDSPYNKREIDSTQNNNPKYRQNNKKYNMIKKY
jgi:hypothetical protein